MLGMPEVGQKVRIWPMPGRRVQNGHRPVDYMGGGRFLDAHGEEVVWSEFHYQQLRAGDILLHAPAECDLPKKPEPKKAEAKDAAATPADEQNTTKLEKPKAK